MSDQFPEGATPDPQELDDDYFFPEDEEADAAPNPDEADIEVDFPVEEDPMEDEVSAEDVDEDEDDS